MFVDPQGKCPTTSPRLIGIVTASALAVASLATVPPTALAGNRISAGAGGTTIDVNGASIPTSELTLAEFGKLQGVPPSTVNAELEGVAAGTPAASAVDAVVSNLTGTTPLATALNDVAGASGGAITPQSALVSVVGDGGQPGAPGSNGSSGSAGGAGTTGSNCSGLNTTGAPARGTLVLRASSRSLRGRPGSHVRLKFTVSSAARIIYGGRNLVTGSRAVRAGTNVIAITFPRKPGEYHLTLMALSVAEAQSTQTTIVLRDSRSGAGKSRNR